MFLLTTTAHPTLYQHPGPNGEPTHPNMGRLIQPRHTSSIEETAAAGIPWAADNDCFQGLNAERYQRMLDRIAGLDGCIFVTVPDVVGDHAATMELFEEWAPVLEELELPLALVAQDGFDAETVPWDRLSALFIGGTDDFKLGPAGAAAAREAKSRGLWVHWGRVNSRKRFDLIAETDAADSFDGSKWSKFRRHYLDPTYDSYAGDNANGLVWCYRHREPVEVDEITFRPESSSSSMVGTISSLIESAPAQSRWIVQDELEPMHRLSDRRS